MPYVFTRVAGTPQFVQKKQNVPMKTPEKKILEAMGLILASTFYTTPEKDTLEVIGLLLEIPFYKDTT